jgi:pimeloyl-ACP methyl ester carboxylesterase
LIETPAADGATVRALFYEPGHQAPVVVHFHGNGETAFDSVWIANELVRRGLGVLLVEYRGYGRSHREPAPTEAGLYADASGAFDWLEDRGIGRNRVVLWGQSLGSGVAAEMAFRQRARALVLVCPYTSMVEMAGRYAPGWLPVNLVVGDRFDTVSKAPHIDIPTLVIHGDQDELIPHAMGKQLAALFPKAQLVTISGGHHNDLVELDRDGVFDAVAALAR